MQELFQTLVNQLYSNWEWIVVDDGSSDPSTIATLRALAARDKRIRLFVNSKNKGISAASNIAIRGATGTHAALVDHDDLISRTAFLAVYEAWKRFPSTQLFFTDECKLLPNDELDDFWAKPAWSPAYLENTMCVGHLAVYELRFLRELGGFRSEYDGTQDFDLALRGSLTNPRVVHLPVFAYLWRAIPGSAALKLEEKSYALQRQGKAVLEYARRKNPAAAVVLGCAPGYWRIIYPLPTPAPLLSYIIMAGRDSCATGAEIDVAACVRSFEDRNFYPNREYIVVHNGTLTRQECYLLETLEDVRVLNSAAPHFNFSQAANTGVAEARGSYICVLDANVAAITRRGGEELISYLVANPNVGLIGPLCLNEDQTIEQNGMMLLGEFGPAHAGHGRHRLFGGHHGNLRCRRETFAVGSTALFIRKKYFETIGGFSEDLGDGFCDVDLCVRLRNRGLSCVVDPVVEVYRSECKATIGKDTEQERLFQRHPGLNDPYFGPWFRQDSPYYLIHLDRDNL